MVIKIENVNFSYPEKDVLKGISLEIDKGDFIGITGSTGSGKTTLAYCLNGLIPNAVRGKFKGSVEVMGLDTRKNKISKMAKKVGLVFQDPDWQLFSLSVREEIMFGLNNLKMENVEKRTKEALKMVGLSGYEETEPNNLSQGQKQKLCIASVLAMEPEVIILDEPTSQLDYKSSVNVYSILSKLSKEGKTIIVIEHDTEILYQYTKKAILLDEGKVVKYDTTKKIFKDKKMLKKLGIKIPCCFLC